MAIFLSDWGMTSSILINSVLIVNFVIDSIKRLHQLPIEEGVTLSEDLKNTH